jgi:hypothetical protein
MDNFWENIQLTDKWSGEVLLNRSLPITFPYQDNQQDFMNLKLEIQGTSFRVLKYRYEKDTLHITYVKDVKEDILNNSYRDWTSTFSQKPLAGKTAPKQFISIEKNYLPRYETISLAHPARMKIELNYFCINTYSAFFPEVPVPPPWNFLSV